MPRSQVELLRAACCIAGLDREIHDHERALLEKLAWNAGVGQASFQAMLDRATADPNFYEEMQFILMNEPEEALRTMFAVAVANHELTTEQRVILHHFAGKLNIDDPTFERLMEEAIERVKQGRATPSETAPEG